MNLRLACNWLRQELVDAALHRVVTKPERLAEEAANWDAAVAEVDEFLDPSPATPDDFEPWADPDWVAAMGGEMAEVG